MAKKRVRELIDTRLEESMDIFQPTADAVEIDDAPQPTTAPRKSRAWEARPENKVFGYRIGHDLNDLLLEAVDHYANDGWQTTVSDVLRAWALAGHKLWEAGEIPVEGKAIKSGARRRTR